MLERLPILQLICMGICRCSVVQAVANSLSGLAWAFADSPVAQAVANSLSGLARAVANFLVAQAVASRLSVPGGTKSCSANRVAMWYVVIPPSPFSQLVVLTSSNNSFTFQFYCQGYRVYR